MGRAAGSHYLLKRTGRTKRSSGPPAYSPMSREDYVDGNGVASYGQSFVVFPSQIGFMHVCVCKQATERPGKQTIQVPLLSMVFLETMSYICSVVRRVAGLHTHRHTPVRLFDPFWSVACVDMGHRTHGRGQAST
jgi:hypothetical protein